LKQTKFKISEKEKFQTVADYLRKMLKSKPSDSIVKSPAAPFNSLLSR